MKTWLTVVLAGLLSVGGLALMTGCQAQGKAGCACAETMAGCKCGHCSSHGQGNCPCGEKDEKHDHKHDHNHKH